jgi:hypothetical protein
MLIFLIICLCLLVGILYFNQDSSQNENFEVDTSNPNYCIDGCLTMVKGRTHGTCLATNSQDRCEEQEIRDFITEKNSLRCPRCRTLYKIRGNKLMAKLTVNASTLEANSESYKNQGYCWARDPKLEQLLVKNWKSPPHNNIVCEGPGPTLKPSDWLIEDKALTKGYVESFENINNLDVRNFARYIPDTDTNSDLNNKNKPNYTKQYDLYKTTKERCERELQFCQNDGKWMQYFISGMTNRPEFKCVNTFLKSSDRMGDKYSYSGYNEVLSKDKCEELAMDYALGYKPPISDFNRIGYLAKNGTEIPPVDELKCKNLRKCENLFDGTSNSTILNSSHGVLENQKVANCVKRQTKVINTGGYTTRIEDAQGYFYDIKKGEEIPKSCLIHKSQCIDPNIGFGNEIIGNPGVGGNPCQ